MYIYGGYDHHGFVCDDLHAYQFKQNKWHRVTGIAKDKDMNTARLFHTAVVHERSMFVFGGKAADLCPPDLLEFHFDTKTWSVVKTTGRGPGPRWGHTAVIAKFHGDWAMYIFGGSDGIAVYAELFVYQFASRTWRNIELASCPSPRYYHACVVARNTSFYIVGGRNVNSCFRDLHNFAKQLSDDIGQHTGDHTPTPTENTHLLDKDPSAWSGATSSKSAKSAKSAPVTPTERKIRLKCHFNGEIRVISVDNTIPYNTLLDRFAKDYGVSVCLKYYDDEGDMVTVRSQGDLDEAISHHFSQSEGATLKVVLEETKHQSDTVQPAKNASDKQHTTRRKKKSIDKKQAAKALADLAEKGTTNEPPRGDSPHASRMVKAASAPTSQNANTSSHDIFGEQNLDDSDVVVHWQKGMLLGKGAFGSVYEAITDSGQMMAVKQITIPPTLTLSDAAAPNSMVQSIQREIDIMQGLSHPNIVRYLGSERTDNTLTIFLELVAGGSIASILKKFQRLNEKTIRSFTRQILSGLQYLHKKGFAHRDIKGANILVTNDGIPKLCDFGCSKKLKDIVSYGQGCQTVTGTPYWMAPEVIKGKNYGRKADVWSLGAVVVEMATGFPPWSDLPPVAALFKIGSEDTPAPIPDLLSDQGKDFLLLCFKRAPEERPTAGDLLKHPFVALDTTSPQLTENAVNLTFKFDKRQEISQPSTAQIKAASYYSGGSTFSHGNNSDSEEGESSDLLTGKMDGLSIRMGDLSSRASSASDSDGGTDTDTSTD
eukprot:TRINITY_DN7518_c0_g2_i1.p1 TRINITY_DN7518_c0_g2~~TRINITY_DN7518_c0_g2_i1.p1  ORF type:complete len:768 (-),score=107.22 TRINITY_DN7518_c0_g2_i1:250-2553(-)